ncbi:DUF3231 family protein [Neobacillus sp. PS3-12]|jgi:hypothetical protein|uniref:DUF3231 family protein n=1 Tax=Neobacillus sp. PS3-12 TaxID=3070677 RepID=UPI0027E1CDC6|nr:DUF3231 family protein [Neobacillus sp. PS3-12]WML52145.1 DUF3231 family protein [Neobacillus sp. PS3-12]
MKTTYDNIRLTAVEIAHLWNGYMAETLVHHIFSHFLQHVDDKEIKSHVEHCHKVSKKIITDFIAVFNKEKISIPRGIKEEDINLKAPRLFSDIFYINYIKNMAKFAQMNYTMAYTESSRLDIRKLFLENDHMLEEIGQMVTKLMLSKGLYARPPHIPSPKEVHFVKQKNPFTGFTSTDRPLSVLEISRLFYNAQSNSLGKALLMGFSQVAQSKDVRENFLKGLKMSKKYYKKFSDVLVDGDIAIPPTFDGEVLDSTESPFSDRLMMVHVTYLNSYGLGTYGLALAQSQRIDLITMYTRTMFEVGAYGNDCATVLINNGWLEEPPLSPNRKRLTLS